MNPYLIDDTVYYTNYLLEFVPDDKVFVMLRYKNHYEIISRVKLTHEQCIATLLMYVQKDQVVKAALELYPEFDSDSPNL